MCVMSVSATVVLLVFYCVCIIIITSFLIVTFAVINIVIRVFKK